MKGIIVSFLLLVFSVPAFSNALDKELDKYWGAKRKIVVIQKKEYTKDGKMELTFFGGMVPNDAFYNSFPLGMRFNWFSGEYLSFGLSGSYHFNSDTGSISVLEKLGVNTKFTEKINWDVALDVSYSLLYGKVAFRKTTMSYFDLYALLFASLYGTEYYPGSSQDNTESSIRYGGGLGFGMRFFLTKSISFKFESRQAVFARTSTDKGGAGGTQKVLELSLGIGWLF